MLKYLRIAVTTFSLTACMLLVALWVRSYWRSSWVRIQFIDWPSNTTSSRDKWYSDYECATFESSGGRLWFELRTIFGGRSGTPWQSGIHWRSFEYDADDAEENEVYLTDQFGVDEPSDLPLLLRSVGFYFGKYDSEWDDGLHLIMPHWLAALALAAFGALPMLKWRFTLRTLLIAMMLVAVVLGIVVAAR